MTARSQLRLFGMPSLEVPAGQRIGFTHERPHQLLALLACRRDWVVRDEIAQWFWPEQQASAARSNLRKVLLLAARVPGVALEREGDRLRFRPDSDLERFEAACDEARWTDAIDAYAAPLLDGMERHLEHDAREWLLAERTRIESRWRAACEQQLDRLADRPADAIALAERLLERDPLDEAAVSALAKARIASGQRDKAANAISVYGARLASAFGTEPSAALRALAHQAAAGEPGGAVSTLPASITFVGRRHELAAIVDTMRPSGPRCLTLVGPGGIGKSTMARTAARQLGQEPGMRTAWIALADLTDVAQVPTRIAASLDLTLRDADDRWRQLERSIGTLAITLVLDNAEHLDLAGPLGDLLEHCPGSRLLVTSRHRLAVVGEQVMPIDGLMLPDDDETDPEVIRVCDSVRLFELRAQAATPHFTLAADPAAVVRLVHLVEGLPLALELAAAWTRVLPVGELVRELEASIDLLDAPNRDERGVRATFEQSWRLLDPAERDCLARLGLLPGSFGRAMALRVCGASLPLLASLIDKSLLRATGDGRLSMHTLIRQCAIERVADADAVRDAHLAYMVEQLGPYSRVDRVITGEVFKSIGLELAHLRAAWARAVARVDVDAMLLMTRPASTYLKEAGYALEGIEAMTAAGQALDAGAAADLPARVLVLRARASLEYEVGRLHEAETSAQQALELAHRIGDGASLVSALNTIGLSRWQRGEFEAARPFFDRARSLATAQDDRRGVAVFTANLAMIDKALGRYEQALGGYLEALAFHRGGNDVPSSVNAMNNIANVYRALLEPDRALALLNEALVLSRQHGLTAVRGNLLVNLGLVHGELGDHAAARRRLDEAWQHVEAHGPPLTKAATLLALADQQANLGQLGEARDKVWQALALADRLDSAALRLQCVTSFGAIVAREGRMAEGCALIRWSLGQSGWNRADIDTARRTLARFADPSSDLESVSLFDPGLSLTEVLALV